MMQFRHLIFITMIGAFTVNVKAQSICAKAYRTANQNQAFNQDPKFLQILNKIVSQSKFRQKVENVEGFNDRILLDASKIEKLVRQETPYTVSMMGKEITDQASELKQFTQFGMVIGDPHFGNFNIQPGLFRKGLKDKNEYTLVDLDEASIGIFSLDFTRYLIFLKARFGNLEKAFGPSFQAELVEAYSQGLQQRERPIPKIIAKKLEASQKDIREKIDSYAKSRVDKDGKFRKEYFKDD
jgi:hypothetical protein